MMMASSLVSATAPEKVSGTCGSPGTARTATSTSSSTNTAVASYPPPSAPTPRPLPPPPPPPAVPTPPPPRARAARAPAIPAADPRRRPVLPARGLHDRLGHAGQHVRVGHDPAGGGDEAGPVGPPRARRGGPGGCPHT